MQARNVMQLSPQRHSPHGRGASDLYMVIASVGLVGIPQDGVLGLVYTCFAPPGTRKSATRDNPFYNKCALMSCIRCNETKHSPAIHTSARCKLVPKTQFAEDVLKLRHSFTFRGVLPYFVFFLYGPMCPCDAEIQVTKKRFSPTFWLKMPKLAQKRISTWSETLSLRVAVRIRRSFRVECTAG